MQPDPDPIRHYLPSTQMVNYSGDVNAPADEVNGWERPVDTGPSLRQFLSASCLPIEPASHEPEVFFNNLFDKSMWTTVAENNKKYARSKIRTDHQGMDAIDVMTHFSQI